MSPSQKNFMRNTTVVIQEHEMWFLFHTAKKISKLETEINKCRYYMWHWGGKRQLKHNKHFYSQTNSRSCSIKWLTLLDSQEPWRRFAHREPGLSNKLREVHVPSTFAFCSDEGLLLETSATLRWPIYIIISIRVISLQPKRGSTTFDFLLACSISRCSVKRQFKFTSMGKGICRLCQWSAGNLMVE